MILSEESGVCFRKYKYNSSNNNILFIDKINRGESVYLFSCKLMKKKIIFLLYV